jgi:hypothetical protein
VASKYATHAVFVHYIARPDERTSSVADKLLVVVTPNIFCDVTRLIALIVPIPLLESFSAKRCLAAEID